MTDINTQEHTDEHKKALESIAKLQAKNAELLAEKQKAKELAEAAQAELEAAEEQTARANNDLKTFEEKLVAKHAKEIAKLNDANAKLTEEITATKGQLSKELIDNAISSAMDAYGVLPHLKKPVMAMIKAEATLEGSEAMAGGMPLAEYIKQLTSSDEGKNYVAAPANSGASVTNVTNAVARAHDFTKENFNSKMGEFAMLAKENPTLAKSIAIEVGRKDLASFD